MHPSDDDYLRNFPDCFGELPPEIVQRIEATDDAALLKAALRQVLHLDSLDDLQI
jgi:hypothetical protein